MKDLRKTRLQTWFVSRNQGNLRELTVRNNLPPLILSLAPLPEDNGGSIAHSTMVLISMECIKVQVDVVHHSNTSEAFTCVIALSPKDRFIQIIRFVWNQANLHQFPTKAKTWDEIRFKTSTREVKETRLFIFIQVLLLPSWGMHGAEPLLINAPWIGLTVWELINQGKP